VLRVKPIRFLGVEDGSFSPREFQRRGKALLCMVLMDGFCFQRVFFRHVEVDGLDATEKLIEVAEKCKPLTAILLGGVTFAGFNIIDPVEAYEKLQVPVIVCTDEKPDNQAVLNALTKHFKDWRERWRIFERLAEASPIYEVKLNPSENPVYMEVVGAELQEVLEKLKRITVRGRIPEPLRIADKIAKVVSQALQNAS